MSKPIPRDEALAKMYLCAKALEQIAKAMGMQRGCTPQAVADEAMKRLRTDG